MSKPSLSSFVQGPLKGWIESIFDFIREQDQGAYSDHDEAENLAHGHKISHKLQMVIGFPEKFNQEPDESIPGEI